VKLWNRIIRIKDKTTEEKDGSETLRVMLMQDEKAGKQEPETEATIITTVSF